MQYSRTHNLLLIENPGVGNSSFASAAKLSRVTDPYSLPTAAVRKKVKEFDGAKKVVIVRAPLDRYLHACTMAMRATGEVLDSFNPDFITLLENVKPDNAAARIAEFIEGFGFDAVPIWFQPQATWLACKMDLILATHNLAEYFTLELGVSQQRTNMTALTPGDRALVRPNTEEIVERLYPDDIKVFDTLPVWSPDPRQVRLLWGFCATCTAKLASKAKPEEPVAEEAPDFSPAFASKAAEKLYNEAVDAGVITSEDLALTVGASGSGEGGDFTIDDVRKAVENGEAEEQASGDEKPRRRRRTQTDD